MEEVENSKELLNSSGSKHYCGCCGIEMEFAFRQDSEYPMVYRCPQCGDKTAYSE